MSCLDFINEKFPIRRNIKEKKDFRDFVLSETKKKGISAKVETTADGKNENVVIGDPGTARVVFTAHYDTPAKAMFPNIMIPRNQLLFWAYQFSPIIFMLVIGLALSYLIGMVWLEDERAYMLTFLAIYYGLYFLMFRGPSNPKNYNDNTSGVATLLSIIEGAQADELSDVAFIFFDNEEKGKKGSKAYFADHKAMMEDKLLINFDCVGNGETIVFIAKERRSCGTNIGCLCRALTLTENTAQSSILCAARNLIRTIRTSPAASAVWPVREQKTDCSTRPISIHPKIPR